MQAGSAVRDWPTSCPPSRAPGTWEARWHIYKETRPHPGSCLEIHSQYVAAAHPTSPDLTGSTVGPWPGIQCSMTRPCSHASFVSHHLSSLSLYTSPGCQAASNLHTFAPAVPSARNAPLPLSFGTWQTLTHPSKPITKLLLGWPPSHLCLHPRA